MLAMEANVQQHLNEYRDSTVVLNRIMCNTVGFYTTDGYHHGTAGRFVYDEENKPAVEVVGDDGKDYVIQWDRIVELEY